jgi:hypothetical protein
MFVALATDPIGSLDSDTASVARIRRLLTVKPDFHRHYRHHRHYRPEANPPISRTPRLLAPCWRWLRSKWRKLADKATERQKTHWPSVPEAMRPN